MEPGAWVTTIPFRGRMIFTDSTYRDTGVFQLYLVAIENIIAGTVPSIIERRPALFFFGGRRRPILDG